MKRFFCLLILGVWVNATAKGAEPRIFHIAIKAEWKEQKPSGSYTHASLLEEGFIHAATPNQLLRVLDKYYRGRNDVLLLELDRSRLTSELRFDYVARHQQSFPHVYGPINISAVKKVIPLQPNEDGTFALPPEVAK